MRKIIPNIVMENCKGALEFYRGVFGGEVRNLQLADGKEMFRGYEGKIIHAELHINGDCILYFNDSLGEPEEGSNINLVLQLERMEEIESCYAALSADGTVEYPLQKTFWGSFHAVVTDRYGVTWSMDCAVN